MSPLQDLADRLRDGLLATHDLIEVGAPYETFRLIGTGEPVGFVRVWTGRSIPKLVDSRLVVPALGIDSVMLHAFAPTDSAVPHLGSDVAGVDGRFSFNLDLTPRVDLALDPGYLDAVYEPVNAARDEAYAIDGAELVDIPLRLRAFSSPWIVGVSVTEDQLPAVERTYEQFLAHFNALLASGVSTTVGGDPSVRDRAQRRAQYDPANDEVWEFLASVFGQPSVDVVLDLIRDVGPPVPR
jgi:hypothetical protein